jgi:pyridoxamine 5'-phosphate oxidase
MKTLVQMLPDPLPLDPMPLAALWLSQAWDEQVQPNPNAFVLATAGPGGAPSARVVLCKDIVSSPGYVVFYTNYTSPKGEHLETNPRASAVFHWDAMFRQMRVEGPVIRTSPAESDDYFASRPWRSRVGAWASQQSRPVASRHALLEQIRAEAHRLGAPDPIATPEDDEVPEFHVPRPPHWGGFRLWAESVEFWVAGEYRVHDRARWTRTLNRLDEGHFHAGPWHHTRLQP